MRALVVVIAWAGVARADTFAEATQAHARGDWRAAISALSTFVAAHPTDPDAVSAGELWIDALTHTGALPDAYQRAIDELANVPGFSAPAPHAWIVRMRHQIAIARARLAEEAQRPDLAGEEYMRMAQDPASEGRDVAYYNAGVMFEEAHDLGRARPMYEGAAKLEHSPVAQEALFRLASSLQFVDPAGSVAVLARIPAVSCPGRCFELAQEARANAGEVYWDLGETAKATAMLEAYLAAGPGRDRARVLEQVALIYEASGQLVRAERAFARLVRETKQPESRTWIRLANTQLALGKRSLASRSYDSAISAAEHAHPGDRDLIGAALFAKAELLAVAAVTAPFDQRVVLVRAAVRAYDDVVTARSAAWSVAALDRQGHLFEDYQRTLVELGGDNLLLANPAQQSYRAAADLARDAHVTTSYTIDAQDALARIDGSYPPRSEHHTPFTATAPLVMVGP